MTASGIKEVSHLIMSTPDVASLLLHTCSVDNCYRIEMSMGSVQSDCPLYLFCRQYRELRLKDLANSVRFIQVKQAELLVSQVYIVIGGVERGRTLQRD